MAASPPDIAQLIVNKSITEFSTLPSDPLLRFVRELLKWNMTTGLVSRRDPQAVVLRLILESQELLELAGRHANIGPGRPRVMDIGSGAGFPGLIWAMQRPEWSITLVERSDRKVAFLEAMVHILGLERVGVEGAQIQDLVRAGNRDHACDIAVSMALGSPVEMGRWVEALLAPGGCYLMTYPSELDLPPTIGRTLRLESTTPGRFGRYACYRAGV